MESAKGSRSPNWSLMGKLVIPCQDGLQYLVRRRIIQTPWFGVYLHHLNAPDSGAPHDHPWKFTSIVLRGGYTEEFYPFPHVARALVVPFFRTQRWKVGSVHRMGTESAHRITDVQPGTVSLLLVGKRRRTWGFFPEGGGWIDWKDYEGEE